MTEIVTARPIAEKSVLEKTAYIIRIGFRKRPKIVFAVGKAAVSVFKPIIAVYIFLDEFFRGKFQSLCS